ncbi:MAG: hypothetical protein ACIARQ_04340 [Phycisphaerales bacterium JB061]
MKRAKPIAAVCLVALAIGALQGCGTTLRDSFYGSRTTGISPVGDAPASAALFRSDRVNPRP